MIEAALALLGGYLVGSIPFSYLVARAFGVADVRKVGSGNVGATNVLRSAGAAAGLLAFALDAGKGAGAVLLARAAGVGEPLLPTTGAAAVLGHMFSVWLGFAGGKGVATGAGAFLPLAPVATAIAAAVFGLTLAATRYVSLSSLLASFALATAAFLLGAPRPVWLTAGSLAALIVWKHRANLDRLAKGTESRLGKKARPA